MTTDDTTQLPQAKVRLLANQHGLISGVRFTSNTPDVVFGEPEVVRIKPSGEVVIAEGANLDDAARAFWNAITEWRGDGSRPTLADVQPGGRVRLGDQLPPLPASSAHCPATGEPLFSVAKMKLYAQAALAAQPSPGGQGDALADEVDLVRAVLDGYPESIARTDALRATRVIRAALAARQPVGEPVAFQLAGSEPLWCLHVLGMDDVHPAPSKAHAEKAAAWHNEQFKDQAARLGISIEAKVVPWPHSAESHAAGLAEFIPDWLIPQWQLDALEANAKQPAQAVESGQTFQAGVAEWMGQCFLPSLYSNMTERGDRLLEEVLELLQAHGYDKARVPTLVDYVFGRPVGEPAQEVGGVMVTLAGYCWVAGLDMHVAGDAELARINQPEVMAKIRAKQEAKNALHFDTPLPGSADAHLPAQAVDLVQIPHGIRLVEIPRRNGLDPINVFVQDYELGRGRIVVTCYGQAWCGFWGAMGDRTVMEFVAACDPDYVAGNMLSGRHEHVKKHERTYVERIATEVIAEFRALTGSQAVGNG